MEKFTEDRKKLLMWLAFAQGAFGLVAGVCLALWPAKKPEQVLPLNRFDREADLSEIMGSI